ncbi:Catechol 2,3-dioxygenase [Halorientalis persicus]|uniref:Catechol 2,3-dioxygenase n=1 Tax=Halorientalis persicus TaxID=1367881 RepID=A0A1H8G967_9EURY|nr:VOC family protein [Halorientalis persicus]SEN40294.1 Catechol 2,3-dioxygenase [Halorientalis persicus]
MADDTPDVTADLPDSPIHTTGTDHITLVGSNEEDTIEFYRDLLGMPLVLRQPNLDDPSSTHLFFDTGDGRIITFFVGDRPSNQQPPRGGVGGVHHLALSIDPERFVEIREALDDADRHYNEFDRGIFHSLYTRDHNGFLLELSTDKFSIPDERKGEVLATAQRIREEAGADFAREEDVEAALNELGIEYDKVELPDAPSGSKF